jgi:flagellin
LRPAVQDGIAFMSNDIVLSSSIRSSLLTLQNTAEMQTKVQERLATGRKVNSALDNPTNFFTAAGLSRRASDLGGLLDAMANGVKTLEAADSGMKSITKVVETMRAYVQQARQDKSFKGVSYALGAVDTAAVRNLAFSGGAVGATPVNVALNTADGTPPTAGKFTTTGNFAATTLTDAADTITFNIAVDGGSATAITISQATLAAVGDGDATLDDVTEFQEVLTDAGVTGVTSSIAGGKLVITSNTTGASSSVAITGYTETDADNDTTDGIGPGASTAGTAAVSPGAVKTVDALVTAINNHASLTGKVRASNDGGKLRIENLSTDDLSLVGATASTVNGGTGSGNTTTIGGNDVRKNLITQFNELRRQLDKISGDSGFNGVNLLRADKLKVVFNETGTSVLDIQAKDTAGTVRGITTDPNSLNIGAADGTEFSDDTKLDARLGNLSDALTVVQTQATAFGSNLATVQIRQEFTKAMINTLQTGADNLTLADTNEEGANLLALNTRQQLSQTALSLAAQASQAVLRLFG